jgi:hypothetical protein
MKFFLHFPISTDFSLIYFRKNILEKAMPVSTVQVEMEYLESK